MTALDATQAPLLVLTATLGKSPWLDDAVRSVAAQAGAAAAHVLIAPARETAGLQLRFPNCRVVAEDLGCDGLYAALNRGLCEAHGWAWQWMTFLADDDLLLPDFSKLWHAARTGTPSGAAAVWQGGVAMVNADGERMCRVPYVRSSRDIAALVAAGFSPFNQQGMLYSRAAAERAGRFEPELRVCGDAAHWLRALERGASFHRVPGIAAAFRVHAGQISGDVERHRREFAGLRRQARKIHGSGPVWPAVLRFRLGNASLYWERVRRVGLRSGFGLLRTA